MPDSYRYHYCTKCWTPSAADAVHCSRCGALLVGPEANSIPYAQKLMLALQHHPEPDVRARAAALLGEATGVEIDARGVARALGAALAVNASAGDIPNAHVQMAAARSLGRLGLCEASSGLYLLAQREDFSLGAGLNAIDALGELAQQGCAEAYDCLTRLAREAGRQAIREEACSVLAHLNEPL